MEVNLAIQLVYLNNWKQIIQTEHDRNLNPMAVYKRARLRI